MRKSERRRSSRRRNNPQKEKEKTDKRNIELKKSTDAFLVWGKLEEGILVKGKAEK